MDGASRLVAVAPLLGLLAVAAVIDVRTRRIPNWLSAAVAAGGLALSITGGGLVGPAAAALGLLVGFALLAASFALRLMGGGDVKLMAAVGAWLGPWGIFLAFVVASVVAMVLALAQCAATGRLRLLLSNAALVMVAARHLPQLGEEHLADTRRSMKSAGRPLPYAVSLLVATVVVLAFV